MKLLAWEPFNSGEYLKFKLSFNVSGITLLAMPEEIFVIDITCLKFNPSISISFISLSSTNLIKSLILYIGLSPTQGLAECAALPFIVKVAFKAHKHPNWISLSVGSNIIANSISKSLKSIGIIIFNPLSSNELSSAV